MSSISARAAAQLFCCSILAVCVCLKYHLMLWNATLNIRFIEKNHLKNTAPDTTKSCHLCTRAAVRSGWQSRHKCCGPNLIHKAATTTWHISIEMPIKVSLPSAGDFPQFHPLGGIHWKEQWSHTADPVRWWNDCVSIKCLGYLSLCTQSQAGLQSVLVAEDALRCGDIQNGPGGAPAWLWLTDQL